MRHTPPRHQPNLVDTFLGGLDIAPALTHVDSGDSPSRWLWERPSVCKLLSFLSDRGISPAWCWKGAWIVSNHTSQRFYNGSAHTWIGHTFTKHQKNPNWHSFREFKRRPRSQHVDSFQRLTAELISAEVKMLQLFKLTKR